jgi:hypothetical protein
MQALTNLPFFEYKNYDSVKGYDVYKLNETKLSNDECHMFFPVYPCEELIVSTALEFLTFHPKTSLNQKFNINPVKCGGIELFWCSFPKEFKDVCQKIGIVYELTMKHFPRVMVDSSGTALEMPKSNNLLVFEGKRCNNPETISKECDNVIWVGNKLEKLGID